MTATALRAPTTPRLLPTERRLLALLTREAADLCQATVDLGETAGRLKVSEARLLAALGYLRLWGLVSVLHSPARFEVVRVSFAPEEVSR